MQNRYLLPILLLLPLATIGQDSKSNVGTFSVGSRNTFSFFNENNGTGKGIGAQFRIQFGKKVNSEWFADFITSKNSYCYRNDYHIGWSLMFYGKNNYSFDRFLQPFLIAGHCFDYSRISENANSTNSADRLSVATQAGLGTHINITTKFDCSLSGQYMLHLGKELETSLTDGKLLIQKADYTNLHGHFLFTISFNYKLFHFLEGKNPE